MGSINDILTLDRLPALPAALARLIPLLHDPDVNWQTIEGIIRQDQALVAAILRAANSAQYGIPGRHFDLRSSMTRLGRGALRRCVLEQQFSQLINNEIAAYGMEKGALWRSSIGGALVSERLAARISPPDSAWAFTCGLLRDIGKYALNITYGPGYRALISAEIQDGRSFIEAEQALWGFDHAQVGAVLARLWRFPERIALAIEKHHTPPAPGPGHDCLIDIVHAADTICRWAGLGLGVDGMEYRLAKHVREQLLMDRRAAELEIAWIWDQIHQAENTLSEPKRTQGASA